HNTKFRAIMYIPWIFYVVHYLRQRRSILALGLTSLILIGQLRENHPQISYYTFLMLGIYWIFQLVWAIKDKEIKQLIIFTSFLIVAVIISFIAVAQPYFSTYEYGEFTIRGGSSGLETSYATSWSFHPMEILTFLNPSFYGGVSPYYWGWMPFTQTSMYMGVIIFLLALVAIFFNRSHKVKVLMTVSIVALFISFGKHLPFLSNLLLNYLPGFNKFRVPAMILILLQFSVVILAGFGLKTIIKKFEEKDKKFFDAVQKVLIGVIILFVLFLIASSLFENLGLTHAGDSARYNASQLKKLKEIRSEKLVNDGIQTGIFIILALGMTLLLGRNKLKKYSYLLLLTILIVVDLLLIDSRFLQNITPKKRIEKQYRKTLADDFLLKDEEMFRIYPLGREFSQNRWAFYNQTIGGYHGAKLKRYQEILDNCLNIELQNRIPINWNIVNMLNAKYVIYPEKLPLENLEYAFYDRKQKQTIYKNVSYLPRTWFVESTELIEKKEYIWKRLNQQEFNPAKMAIIEEEIPKTYAPDSTAVNLVEFDIHSLKFEVKTDTTSFLTISEIYYPAGWKAFIDGKETEIYATNYILRGVVIPKGEHILEMKFAPRVYTLSLKLSLIGIILTIVLLIVGLFLYIRENYRGEIIYVLKK
ncbi:MAG: YfhO family protein, partial [Candidatus Cloacimonetes bacterium]|nr:YfhO family protein [Candidatus Cloacimonadota bacterium]